MPSPPHPRLRNRHSLPRAVSNGAHPSDYAARALWTAIPCDSLEYRRLVSTSESPTIRELLKETPTMGGGCVGIRNNSEDRNEFAYLSQFRCRRTHRENSCIPFAERYNQNDENGVCILGCALDGQFRFCAKNSGTSCPAQVNGTTGIPPASEGRFIFFKFYA